MSLSITPDGVSPGALGSNSTSYGSIGDASFGTFSHGSVFNNAGFPSSGGYLGVGGGTENFTGIVVGGSVSKPIFGFTITFMGL